MSMLRKDGPGAYRVGIYEIIAIRERKWRASAFGPGTVGDGLVGEFSTLAAAYLAVTGEPLRDDTKRGVPRPIRIEGDVAYIPLSRGMEAVIDAADVPLVADRNWYALRSLNTFYAVSSKVIDGKKRQIRLHTIIAGQPGAAHIDHEDRDGLNCRRSNLRPATPEQNAWNSGPNRKNTSGFKGVGWDRYHQRWVAQIRVNRKQIRLGRFKTAEEASRAYEEAAIKYRGEFGRVR